jgi:hypothetical protein
MSSYFVRKGVYRIIYTSVGVQKQKDSLSLDMFIALACSLLLQLPSSGDNVLIQQNALEFLKQQGIDVTVKHTISQVINNGY